MRVARESLLVLFYTVACLGTRVDTNFDPELTEEPNVPYEISTAEQFLAITKDANAYYVLKNDIDLSGWQFSAAPIETFSGHFNGCGHRIYNLTIDGSAFSYNTGLFSILTAFAEIRNLGIVDANVQATSISTGNTGG